MDVLTRHELGSLMEIRGGHQVSILMPTHRTGPATRQHRLRFKNLLGLAEKRLRDAGLRQPEALTLLEPARRLLYDGLFWSHQGDGLAIFIAEGMARILRLPMDVPEIVVVSDRFHVKPLLPLISCDGRFYLLTISRKRVRLFQGSRHSLVELGLDGVQGSLGEALRGENPQRQLQFHTGTHASRRPRRRSAVFHGHGAGSDEAKARTLHYFHQVDATVCGILSGEQSPLVVASVNYLQPIYAEANRYPFLAASIIGSPSHVSMTQLHRRAWEVVAPEFTAAQHKAARRYRRLEGTGLTCRTLEVALPASHRGQVDALFAAVGVQQWGSYDPRTNLTVLHHEEEPGDEDLLNLAAVQAFVNGGTVYVVEPHEMPESSPLVALLRWEDTEATGAGITPTPPT